MCLGFFQQRNQAYPLLLSRLAIVRRDSTSGPIFIKLMPNADKKRNHGGSIEP